ncbi:ABC transporter ATP-binding protein [Terrarubrum flagellatum]|uniref:ABC transporter ATP-binding protein n=1 Tax=Terrirubrum flagellatum TaxID=2895980 RepID=UPI0031451208
MNAPLLDISELSVSFRGERGAREVVSRASFEVREGEILGVVGESGSGKSVTALAVMRLLGEQGAISHGDIRFEGGSLSALDEAGMRRLRGRRMAMIFQEPMTSLNPLLRVGFQIEEVLRAHLDLGGAAARERGLRLLEEVGVPAAAERYDDYPHRLSGGMRQRVMIAMAMACEPRLLIADEPTTALDVTIQAQILELMKRLRREHRSAILLITHDMGVIARMADRVAVMYAGEVVEIASVRDIFSGSAHPYTRLLLQAMPTARRREARLPVIPGQMPAPGAWPGGCRFRTRCPHALAMCAETAPALAEVGPGRLSRCLRAHEFLPGVAA